MSTGMAADLSNASPGTSTAAGHSAPELRDLVQRMHHRSEVLEAKDRSEQGMSESDAGEKDGSYLFNTDSDVVHFVRVAGRTQYAVGITPNPGPAAKW